MATCLENVILKTKLFYNIFHRLRLSFQTNTQEATAMDEITIMDEVLTTTTTTTTTTATTALPPTRDEEIVEMYSQGIPVQDICVELGIAPPTLYYTLRRMGVAIDRKNNAARAAHPIDIPGPTEPQKAPIEKRPVGRPPKPGFTHDVEKVILQDFKTFGSARKVAALNRLSYWSVLKFLRAQGEELHVGSKRKALSVCVDLVGKQLTHKNVEEIRIAYERFTQEPSIDLTLEDFAAEYGISVATLETIITSLDRSAQAAKSSAVAELQAHPSEVVTAMMNEVEGRLRAKLESDLQLQLQLQL